MIIYEIICENGHPFEGWFKDNDAFQEQLEKRLIQCPVCLSFEITQRLSTGGFVKERQAPETTEITPAQYAQAMLALQEYVKTNFEDVGAKFAETALKIHYGAEDPKNIRGTTTEDQEEMLKEEGVAFCKVPLLPDIDSSEDPEIH